MASDLGKVSAFWHRQARMHWIGQANAATLEMFEGLTISQLNDALFRFDSDGKQVRA